MRAYRPLVALVVLSACAHAPAPRPAQSVEMIAVLPEEGGKVGVVTVRASGGERVLDTPYAATRIEAAGKLQDIKLDAAQVAQKFGVALAAMPAKPASFALYFLEGSDELAPESRGELARIGAEIAARPAPEIAVIGHTDLVGSEEFNNLLSMHRAQRVREELVRAGIASERVELVARGKREPLFPTAEGVAEPRNRRVEINVR